MDRIFYFSPDLAKPAGGIRRLYRHVEILNQHHFAAYIVHTSPDFKIDWFHSDAPIQYLRQGVEFNPSDVLVIPETCQRLVMDSNTAAQRRVVMALNWAYIYLGFPPGKDYRHFGIKDVICGSEYIREFIFRNMGIQGHVVRLGIDTDLFVPNPNKKRQIACMPRKNAQDLHNIECCFRSRFPEFADVPFVRIDNAKTDEVARILGESDVFLATGYPEGFSRPPLEAMACGCAVVGFTGRGALEFMSHRHNCLIAEDGDVLTAAENLALSLKFLGSEEACRMQSVARETALRYSFAEEEKAVVRYWEEFFENSASRMGSQAEPLSLSK
jgi:glycosyltransferase involved in cell wall biosynthesis